MPRRTLSALFLALSAIIAAPAGAATLKDYAGPGVYAGWIGTTPFDADGNPATLEGDDLEGYIDWAVFSPGAFPFTGYTPTPGELAYVYQVRALGNAGVTSFTAAIDSAQPVDNIGFFDDPGNMVTGQLPTAANFQPFPPFFIDSAEWLFAGIDPGSTSSGLVFSSPRVPMDYFGSAVNHGTNAFVLPIPSPSPLNIPEPATMTLAGMGLIGLAIGAVRSRRSRAIA